MKRLFIILAASISPPDSRNSHGTHQHGIQAQRNDSRWIQTLRAHGTGGIEALSAGGFDAVDINNTFYHLPSPEVIANWHDSTPADFTFAVKASRFITRINKLANPEVHAYFNNDSEGHAVRDACKLGKLL